MLNSLRLGARPLLAGLRDARRIFLREGSDGGTEISGCRGW
jgi:hypothetical protein